MKRWIALLLVLALLPVPAVFAKKTETGAPRLITEADYAAVDQMWLELDSVGEKALRAHRSESEAVASAVEENALYKEGSLRWQGEDHFTFETTVGVTCAYSARVRELAESVQPYEGETTAAYENISYGTSNSANARDVYVFQPYYGIDSSFTRQYQTEGQTIAEAIGGTYHLYTRTDANIDVIADALEQGAVVIFDSHGDTDYASGEDYTTGATTSYLLLQTGDGLTDADYAYDNGTYHAYYYGRYQNMYYYAVDGTCIANHMGKTAPNSLLWMAICLSMATDGLHAPLMERGAAVAYGYSQSVTFGGDYCWESCFWEQMCSGAAVKDAVAEMKEKYGCWDYSPEIYSANGWSRDSYYCDTIEKALRNRAAFPIVVSAEDLYPGHGNVDALQTVNSTWVLPGEELPVSYTLTVQSNDNTLGTVILNGDTVTALPVDHAYVSGWSLEPADAARVEQIGNEFYVTELTADCCLTVEFLEKPKATVSFAVPEGCEKESQVTCLGEGFPLTPPTGEPVADAYDYRFLGWSQTQVTDTDQEPLYYTDYFVPEAPEVTLYALYTYSEADTDFYTTELSMKTCPSEAFADVNTGAWYHEALDYVLEEGLMKGVSDSCFDPEGTLTRAMLATILYRMSGESSTGTHPFTDVAAGVWYAEAVAWAYERQIVNGVSATAFQPDAPVTREQAASMLYRYAKTMGYDVTPEGNLSQFKDADEISGYAVLPLRWAVGEGIINGTGADLLAPTGSATRAQIAKIIYAWLKNQNVQE